MQILYWLINTQTIGGLVVIAAFTSALLIYLFTLRWIIRGAEEDEE
jgi:hypothetical protein